MSGGPDLNRRSHAIKPTPAKTIITKLKAIKLNTNNNSYQ